MYVLPRRVGVRSRSDGRDNGPARCVVGPHPMAVPMALDVGCCSALCLAPAGVPTPPLCVSRGNSCGNFTLLR